jgi:hypothetical protein
MSKRLDIKSLILIPAIITLAVSCLRLIGELMGWNEILFGRAAGGGFALIGIVWLVPIFGIYFGWRLTTIGSPAKSPGKLIGLSLLSAVIVFGVFGLLYAASLDMPTLAIIVVGVISIGAMYWVKSSWPELFKTLVTYAFAARVPVMLIMFFAIMGNWGTHYDAPPPEMEGMSSFVEWVVTGVIPQLTVWIWFTVTVGALFAGLGALVLKKS